MRLHMTLSLVQAAAPLLFAVGLLGFSASPVEAQWGGMGWGYGMGGGYASTAEQGAAYGLSSVVRAEGYTNLKNSEAAKNWEEAKTQEIQNRQRWTETYFDMRKTNTEARTAEEGPRVTREQAVRLAQMQAPRRLTSTQLDPVTGHIEYPLVLTSNVYMPYRSEVDKLFSDRASSGGSLQYEDFQRIQGAVTNWAESLKEHVKEYPAGEYGKARTFLDSLANEAKYPAG